MRVLTEARFVIRGLPDSRPTIECFSNGVPDPLWFSSCSIGGIGVFDSLLSFDPGLMLRSRMISCMLQLLLIKGRYCSMLIASTIVPVVQVDEPRHLEKPEVVMMIIARSLVGVHATRVTVQSVSRGPGVRGADKVLGEMESEGRQASAPTNG